MSDAKHRDSKGKALDEYERPSVAVDTAVFSLSHDNALLVLEVRRPTGRGWALPGTFLHKGETLAKAVDRSLREKADVRGLRPRQFHVFDNPRRDHRGWVLSVAHIAVVQPHQLESRTPNQTRLAPARDPGALPFDHPTIVELALQDLQARYADRPDPDGLLGDEFTLFELRAAHEAVAGKSFQRDVFRRAMSRFVTPTGQLKSEGRGRPAETYRRQEVRA